MFHAYCMGVLVIILGTRPHLGARPRGPRACGAAAPGSSTTSSAGRHGHAVAWAQHRRCCQNRHGGRRTAGFVSVASARFPRHLPQAARRLAGVLEALLEIPTTPFAIAGRLGGRRPGSAWCIVLAAGCSSPPWRPRHRSRPTVPRPSGVAQPRPFRTRWQRERTACGWSGHADGGGLAPRAACAPLAGSGRRQRNLAGTGGRGGRCAQVGRSVGSFRHPGAAFDRPVRLDFGG
jgi:hypothetical protein